MEHRLRVPAKAVKFAWGVYILKGQQSEEVLKY